MAVEIERKFLVRDESWRATASRTTRIKQDYLCTDTSRSVRVRTRNDDAWITIKGSRRGIARAEFEYSVPMSDALEMLEMAVATLEKLRHEVPHGDHVWEVDEFDSPNAPLVFAEVEFGSEDEAFERPAWPGQEVSDNPRTQTANWRRSLIQPGPNGNAIHTDSYVRNSKITPTARRDRT
jgi:adenylate cyclase